MPILGYILTYTPGFLRYKIGNGIMKLVSFVFPCLLLKGIKK